MDRWQGKVAVVTGASSGIGYASAKSLVNAGLLVVAIARRKEKIDELKNETKNSPGKLVAVSVDLTKEENIITAFDWIRENVGPIHILINNAGVSRLTNLIDGKSEYWKDVWDTNVMALCIATREAVRVMQANHIDGHVIHINSVLGHKVNYYPTANVYPATKYAVTALAETLKQELNAIGSKIKITSISPGFVWTEMLEAACIGSGYKGMTPEVQQLAETVTFLQPVDIADAIIYVLGTPPHVQIRELIIEPTQSLTNS